MFNQKNAVCTHFVFACTYMFIYATIYCHMVSTYCHRQQNQGALEAHAPLKTTVYGKTFEWENFRSFRGFLFICECFPANFSFCFAYHMALFKYFEVQKESQEYWRLPLITQRIVPPRLRNTEHSVEMFLGT